MVKKQYSKVIGLKNGKGLTELAQFDEKKDANWHIKSTFESLGFDKLLIKTSSVKDKDLYIKAEDAQNKDTFMNTLIIMNKLDWETVTTRTQFNTLLGFLHSKELEKTAQLGKFSEVLSSEDVEIEDDEFAVAVIQDLNTALPLDKAKTKLTKAIMDELLGSDDSEEDLEDEDEEVDEPAVEVVVDEPVIEVPVAVKKAVKTPVVEAPIVETVVEKVIEAPIVETVAKEIVEAPVVETVVEKVIEAPIAEVIEVPVVETVVKKEVSVEELVEAPVSDTVAEVISEKEVDISDLLSDDAEEVVVAEPVAVKAEAEDISALDLSDFDFGI